MHEFIMSCYIPLELTDPDSWRMKESFHARVFHFDGIVGSIVSFSCFFRSFKNIASLLLHELTSLFFTSIKSRCNKLQSYTGTRVLRNDYRSAYKSSIIF